ncbi:cytidylate kinase [Candidatus Dependentiae bacterium Noda2021]|nr:cytidylate kinase [Candidatus Dependentiae bacterium Noda2021]
MIITIDGPSASGKSTVARGLATRLNFYYIASGMLFRAIAYVVTSTTEFTLDTLADSAGAKVQELVASGKLRYTYDKGHEKIYYDNVEITPFLKTSTLDQYASIIATNKTVRDCINAFQRSIADDYNIVADGRDMASVVFPTADVKFFLTATLRVRAHRWQKDQAHKGLHFTYDQACDALQERDERDKVQLTSPLLGDIIVVDNSSLTIEQTIETLLGYILNKKGMD